MKIKIILSTILLLSLTGCLTKQKINNLAEAENQVITQDGRHFFTSSSGIAELTFEYGQKKITFYSNRL
jgi:hypothetical protein